ncbi:MAG: hypothetical protein ACT4PZ_10555 [Panacagrimonas sp.]
MSGHSRFAGRSFRIAGRAGAASDSGDGADAIPDRAQGPRRRRGDLPSQIEHDAYELVGCVQARANESGALSPTLAQAHRLGALFRGWLMADVAAAFAVDGAKAAATELMRAAAVTGKAWRERPATVRAIARP